MKAVVKKSKKKSKEEVEPMQNTSSEMMSKAKVVVSNDDRDVNLEFLSIDDEMKAFSFWKENKLAINNNAVIRKFRELKDERMIFLFGKECSDIPNDIKTERFNGLKEGEWIYKAGLYWKGLTDKTLNEKSLKMFQD